MRVARFKASGSTWSCATTWLTRPKEAARWASRLSAVIRSSIATLRGKARGRRYSPPAAASSPRDTSGSPKLACEEATARSQASTISQPPASALPFTAAIHGFLRSASTKPAKPLAVNRLSTRPAATSLRSAPAQKASAPAPVSTTTHTSGSASVRSTAACKACANSALMALRAVGRFSVTTATWSAHRTQVTTSAADEDALMTRSSRSAARPRRG